MATEEKLVRGMTPEEKEDYRTLPAEARAQAVRDHLIKQRRKHLVAWKARLCDKTAIDAMLKACTRFKKVAGTVTTWKGEEKEWKTFAQTLQGDADERRKILYFRDVAVG